MVLAAATRLSMPTRENRSFPVEIQLETEASSDGLADAEGSHHPEMAVTADRERAGRQAGVPVPAQRWVVEGISGWMASERLDASKLNILLSVILNNILHV